MWVGGVVEGESAPGCVCFWRTGWGGGQGYCAGCGQVVNFHPVGFRLVSAEQKWAWLATRCAGLYDGGIYPRFFRLVSSEMYHKSRIPCVHPSIPFWFRSRDQHSATTPPTPTPLYSTGSKEIYSYLSHRTTVVQQQHHHHHHTTQPGKSNMNPPSLLSAVSMKFNSIPIYTNLQSLLNTCIYTWLPSSSLSFWSEHYESR